MGNSADNVVCDICYSAGMVAEKKKWWHRRGKVAKGIFPAATIAIAVYSLSGKILGGAMKDIYLCSKHYRVLIKLLDLMSTSHPDEISSILSAGYPEQLHINEG